MYILALYAPTPQNGQTHSKNSSATVVWTIVWVFDHFVGLALTGLGYEVETCTEDVLTDNDDTNFIYCSIE